MAWVGGGWAIYRRLFVAAMLTLMVSACDDTASTSGVSRVDGGDQFQATVGTGACDSDPFIVCCLGSLTNTLSATSGTGQSFWITVAFIDAEGIELAEGGVAVTDLGFQETADWEVGRRGGGEFGRCEIRSVTAYDS